jgi:hypothetical protein
LAAFGGQLGRSGLGRFEPGKGADLGERATVVGVAVVTGVENIAHTDTGTATGVGVATGVELYVRAGKRVMVGDQLVMVGEQIVMAFPYSGP